MLLDPPMRYWRVEEANSVQRVCHRTVTAQYAGSSRRTVPQVTARGLRAWRARGPHGPLAPPPSPAGPGSAAARRAPPEKVRGSSCFRGSARGAGACRPRIAENLVKHRGPQPGRSKGFSSCCSKRRGGRCAVCRAPVQAAFIGQQLLFTASDWVHPHFQSGHYGGRLSDPKPVPPGPDRGALTFPRPYRLR